jgi:hypothetical protein
MRVGKYRDAATTASQLEVLGDPVEWWDKKSEALILDDRSQEVLDSWECKKTDSRFADNVSFQG